jgi:hypothetical protein
LFSILLQKRQAASTRRDLLLDKILLQISKAAANVIKPQKYFQCDNYNTIIKDIPERNDKLPMMISAHACFASCEFHTNSLVKKIL